MIPALEVNDSQSNRPELIKGAVDAIGKSKLKRKVFEAIYHHKTRIKSVVEIAAMTGLSTTRVLQLGGELSGDHIVNKTKKDGRTAYEQKPFYQHNKAKILRLLDRPSSAAKIATKRNITVNVHAPRAGRNRQGSVQFITVDDIDSFSKVREAKSSAKSLPSTMTEEQFKHGVQAIIGETGTFKDWGGETSDLFSTRLIFRNKRRRVAFGFKGPGLSGPLVPARLGKNGDQIQRLFSEPADIFFVQHWREIRQSVVTQMEAFAEQRASRTKKPVWYGIIDGHDSNRLRLAYPTRFKTKKRKRPPPSRHRGKKARP